MILKEVIQARDIMEFDLRNFFSLVNLDKISVVLIKKGVPISIVKKLYYINASAIKLRGPARLNEFEHMMKKLIMSGTPEQVVDAPRPIGYTTRLRGIPQGASTSPLLATLILENAIMDRGVPTVMYADDGLYYGNIDQPLITPNSGMLEGNIFFNLEKTSYVKKDGVWLKPLKFLGLIYDGETDTLKSETRKGASLVYDKEELVKAITEQEKGEYFFENKPRDTWEDFVKSRLAGFLQSRLYAGN